MAAAAVDVSFVAKHLGLPEPTITAVATEPTVDLVKAVLDAVAAKALEFETLAQQKSDLEIELEGAIRGSEARCEQFKANTDKALKEVEDIRQKLHAEENVRQTLENELQSIKSSSTTSLSEIETLRARIASLETSNRETLAIVDSKTQANASLSEELQKQHQKILKLNQEITALNQSVQAAQTAANSAKHREDLAKQEVELAKRNTEWLETELKTKSAEALKYRKEKGARIAELQRQNDDANTTIESLTRSEQTLRRRLEEAQARADDSLTKVQQLQEAAARAEDDFRRELDNSRRLVELKDQQSQTHRDRLREVETYLEKVKDDSAAEIRSVRQELEQERASHAQTEEQTRQLQGEIDQLQARREMQLPPPGSVPQTPQPNGLVLGRASSPFGTPGTLRGRASFRASDAIQELYDVKAELAKEKRANKELSAALDDAMGLIDAKVGEWQEAQAQVKSSNDVSIEMSQLAEQAYGERDAALKTARKAEAAATSAQSEVKILQGQLRDLSTQVHALIFNIHAAEKGLDQLTSEELEQFERIKRGEVSEDSLDDQSDTNQFISRKFVVFKDIYELQAQNQELLRITRELADKMENEEAIAAKQQAAHDHQKVQTLGSQIVMLQDEVKTVTKRMKGYVTERDMFRRMLQQRASAAEINAVLGSPADGSQREVLASIENTASDDAELGAALRDLQTRYDAERNDYAIERKSMREQMEKLSTEKRSLQSDVARITSQLELANERYRMLQENFQAAQSEIQELQKRNQVLSESEAKLDIRTQQASEDLVEAQGMLESMRSENANLKAEKNMWKEIQERLSRDNENLAQEKARLNTLLANQQSLLNERELSESETRRRLENQVDSLETELSSTKRKLSEEMEESKKAQLRKEFDAQQSQKRIDELSSTLTQVKEEAAAAKTSRDHFQARVSELEIELRNAQARNERLRPQLTARSQPAAAVENPGDQEDQARIQELEDEVAELKNSLELAKAQLENAQAQAEQYKALTQEVEEQLESLNAVQDQYREEADASIAAKESTIKELQQRTEALTSELSNSTNELNALRDSQADVARKYEDKERMLNAEIERLKEEELRYKETARFHQQDLRAQADIATKAQRDYEQELVKHAEAAKSLQELRKAHNELKTQSASWKAEADSARLTLTQNEQSWEERRQQYEREVREIKVRRDDMNAQNKILHQQLETVTSQINSLKQNRASLATSVEGAPPAVADVSSEGLRELTIYLRREKEILEVQFEMKTQEARRLQQQLEYSQLQLEETRLKLDQERRSQADSSRSAMSHKELMDKLNELNLIRESNVTLRNENQRTHAQLEQKTKRIEELEAKVQPLEARISELELEQSFKEAEIKQLQEDRERSQKRIESILSKYGQSDPEETEQLKKAIASLESERDVLKQSETALQDKIKELEAMLQTKEAGWMATREKLAAQFKQKYADAKAKNQEELGAASERLSGIQQSLEAIQREKASLEEKVREHEQQAQAAALSIQSAPAQAAPAQVAAEAGGDALLAQQLEIARQELETMTAQRAEAVAELESLRLELVTITTQRDEALARAAQQPTNGIDATMEDAIAAPQTASAGLSDEERQSLEEKIAAAEARAEEADKKAKELEEHMDAIVKRRSDSMKTALNKKLLESKESLEKKAAEDKAALLAEFELKLEQERAIWKAENPASAAPQNGVPSTPAKAAEHHAPATPNVGTLSSSVDLSSLNDTQTRELVANNPTIKAILANNIKKGIEVEKKRVREEVEAKTKGEVDTRVSQAVNLAEKKTSLRLNMLERKAKTAEVKLEVVETAAKETPQRPVVEVWEIAKTAKPPAPAQTAPSTASAAATVASPAAVAEEAKATQGNAVNQAPVSGIPQPAKPVVNAQAVSAPAAGAPPATAAVAPNPFASGLPAAPPVHNPFATPGQGAPPAATQATVAQPAAAQSGQQAQQPNQPARTGIPVPSSRGGAQGRGGRGGGVYQAPGRGGQGARGRGGFTGGRGGAQSLNPQAGDFNPGTSQGAAAGNKRPRNDSEAGAGNKRQRGGGGGGAPAT